MVWWGLRICVTRFDGSAKATGTGRLGNEARASSRVWGMAEQAACEKGLCVVVHACNPRYMGGCPGQPGLKNFLRPHLQGKKLGVVVHACHPGNDGKCKIGGSQEYPEQRGLEAQLSGRAPA
jgi:hypothetical protein